MIPEWATKKIKNTFSEELLSWRVKLIERSIEFSEKKQMEKSNQCEEIIAGIIGELKRRVSDKSVDDNLSKQAKIPEIGVMRTMGYHVGKWKGLKPETRRRILREIFTGPLIMVGSLDHMEEWGEDRSKLRLEKIKRNLKSFISANENREELRTAVLEWKADLDYVNKTFGES